MAARTRRISSGWATSTNSSVGTAQEVISGWFSDDLLMTSKESSRALSHCSALRSSGDGGNAQSIPADQLPVALAEPVVAAGREEEVDADAATLDADAVTLDADADAVTLDADAVALDAVTLDADAVTLDADAVTVVPWCPTPSPAMPMPSPSMPMPMPSPVTLNADGDAGGGEGGSMSPRPSMPLASHRTCGREVAQAAAAMARAPPAPAPAAVDPGDRTCLGAAAPDGGRKAALAAAATARAPPALAAVDPDDRTCLGAAAPDGGQEVALAAAATARAPPAQSPAPAAVDPDDRTSFRRLLLLLLARAVTSHGLRAGSSSELAISNNSSGASLPGRPGESGWLHRSAANSAWRPRPSAHGVAMGHEPI